MIGVIRSVYRKFTVVALAVSMAIFFLIVIQGQVDKDVLPVFSSYTDVLAKKQAFITFFEKKIEQENAKIQFKRQKFFVIYAAYALGDVLSMADNSWILKLAAEYKIKNFNIAEKLKWLQLSKAVDIIPRAMALGQGAVESAWGTSRFAVQGSNFFGMWCYTKGCGMVPRQRKVKLTHEVKVYQTADQAVRHYFHTLNTHLAYQKFRDLRYSQRKKTGKLSGYALIGTLDRYSEMGEQYIALVRQVIKGNQLE